MQLDLLPPDLAGQVQALQEYEWTSSEARERFDELMDQLRQELMQSYFNQMAGAMSDISPEQLQRMKDMFNALNELLEMRERGQDTDAAFERFMEQFGDFFPGRSRDPRRAARADGRADGGHAEHAQLHDARAAGPAPGPGRGAARGHGPALAGRPAGGQPAPGVPGGGLGPQPRQLQRPGPARLRRGGRAHEPAGRDGPAGEPAEHRPPARGPWPTSTSNPAREILGDDGARVPRAAGRAGQAAGGGRA